MAGCTRWSANELIYFLIAVTTLTLVGAYWSGGGRAWVHPELLRIGNQIWSGEITVGRLFHLFFDWQYFDYNPHRQRIFSDAMEIVDATARPHLSNLYFHPTFSVTFCIFFIATPFFVSWALRLHGISWGSVALACSVLLASPGALSNLFAYIRPAKPLSFVVLAIIIYFFTTYVKSRQYVALFGTALSMLIGFFTDEFLYFAPFFCMLCLWLTKREAIDWRSVAILLSPVVFYAILALFVLPHLYGWFGPNGPRPMVLTNPQTGDQPLARMLSYLWSVDFMLTALKVTARSFLAHLGIYTLAETAFMIIGSILVFATLVFVVISRAADGPEWRLLATALLGFVSFSAFSTWLDWYNGPHSNEDLGALVYYYHSPVSVFFALAVAALAQIIALASRKRARLWVAGLAIGCAVLAVNVGSVWAFLPLNDLVRLVHLGPTEHQRFFDIAQGTLEPPYAPFVTGDAGRADKVAAQIQDLGHQVLGVQWEQSSLFRQRSDFDSMPWYGPSYTQFGRLYLSGLCTLFYGAEPCPMVFVDSETPI